MVDIFKNLKWFFLMFEKYKYIEKDKIFYCLMVVLRFVLVFDIFCGSKILIKILWVKRRILCKIFCFLNNCICVNKRY